MIFLAEGAWNRSKAKAVDLRVVPSIWDQCGFVRDTADCRDEVEAEVGDAKEDWDIKGMLSINEAAASRVRGRLKETRRHCEHEWETVLATVVEVFEILEKLSRQTAIMQTWSIVITIWSRSWSTCDLWSV